MIANVRVMLRNAGQVHIKLTSLSAVLFDVLVNRVSALGAYFYNPNIQDVTESCDNIQRVYITFRIIYQNINILFYYENLKSYDSYFFRQL